MKAYSEDLRKNIVASTERGRSKAQAARLFDVSLSSVKRYSRTATQGGSLEPRRSPGRPRKADEKTQLLLRKDVEERPAVTISQRRRFLEHIARTDPKRLHRQAADEAAGLHSKRTVGALERTEWLGAAWRVMVPPNHLMLGDWCLWM